MAEVKKVVRMFGINLDGSRKVEHALRQVPGIGFSFARAVRVAAGIAPEKRLGELSEEELRKIEEIIKDPLKYNIPAWMLNRRKEYETGKDIHLISHELEIAKAFDIKRLQEIKSWRGIRHAYGYKLRGQRTCSHGAKQIGGRTGQTLGVKRKKE